MTATVVFREWVSARWPGRCLRCRERYEAASIVYRAARGNVQGYAHHNCMEKP